MRLILISIYVSLIVKYHRVNYQVNWDEMTAVIALFELWIPLASIKVNNIPFS